MTKQTESVEIPSDHILAGDPNIVKLWALFQTAWDNTECNIMSLFQVVTRVNPFVTQVIVARSGGIFSIIHMINDLSGSVAAGASFDEHSPTLSQEQNALIMKFAAELKDVTEIRNRLIHGRWCLWDVDTGKAQSIRRITFRPNMVEAIAKDKLNFSTEEIRAYIEVLEDLTKRIGEFSNPILCDRIKKDVEDRMKQGAGVTVNLGEAKK